MESSARSVRLSTEGRPLQLLVSIPALDEEKTIEQVIRGVPSDIPGIGEIEVLVVDDGGSDRTGALAREAGATVIRHPVTLGVGAAFHTALTHGIDTGADVLVTIDGDGQFDPADIPEVAAPVIAGEADFTSASRFKDPALVPEMPKAKLWGNRAVAWIISRLTGQRFYDVSCGMRCYSRQAALQLHLIAKFTYTQEVFLNLSFKGLRLLEVPTRVRGEREFGESRVASNLWRYGLRTSDIIFRSYRDYYPLRFFGGIALGLLAPASLLALFLLGHYLTTGSFTPHKWAGFSAAALGVAAILLIFMGLIGDMMNRHRIYLEEILYRQRSAERDRHRDFDRDSTRTD